MSPHLLLRSLGGALLASAAMAQITPGNVVVMRVGDGTAALSNSSTAAFLDEYTSAGAFVQSIALPTAASAPNLPMTLSGTATSEGFLSLSGDGQYLVCTGYATVPGSIGSVVTTTSAAVPRVIARVALNGTIDTTTSMNNVFSGGNPRGVCTEDGSQFWVNGSNTGTAYTVYGGTTGTVIQNVTTNVRVPQVVFGQLWLTTGSGTNRGINAVGTGEPTTSGQTLAVLNGMASGTSSPYDFWFADPQTVYIADDRTVANGGGIQKWTESAGTWTLAYTLTTAPAPSTVAFRGLSGIKDQLGTTLFATTTDNKLVSVVDIGPTSTFNFLVTAATNTAFRGVRYIRVPNSATVSGIGCAVSTGDPTIGTAGGYPVSGNGAFGLAVGNTPPFSLYLTIISIGQPITPGFPLSFVGGPPCSTLYTATLDILLAGVTDIVGNGVVPVSLAPVDNTLWGLVLGTQHLVFDSALYGAYGLPVGNTPGLQIQIGN